MRSARSLVVWVLVGAVGLGLYAWAYPRAFPFTPRHWTVTREQATAIALARLKDLGPAVQDPYVVALLRSDPLLERRLQLAIAGEGRLGLTEVRRSDLAGRVEAWEILVYPPDAQREDWTYRAQVSMAGEVLGLRLRLDPEVRASSLSATAARQRADEFLRRQGVDLARFAPPEIRSQQLAARTDLAVRYADRLPVPGAPKAAHGLAVHFAGDRLAGFDPWLDDPEQKTFERLFQQNFFAGMGGLVATYCALFLLAVPFLRRYHEGVIGVRRGGQIFLLIAGLGLVTLCLSIRAMSQGFGLGFATRQQITWLGLLFTAIFTLLPSAILAFFAWSVGESICRERWGWKIAAFDALFQGAWANATVARAALVGSASGFALAGGLAAACLPLQRFGAWPLASAVVAGGASSLVPGLQMLGESLLQTLPMTLVLTLCFLPVAVRRLGVWGGALAALPIGTVVLFQGAFPLPLGWGFAVAALFAGALVGLFLRYDLLAVLLAGAVTVLLLTVYPLLAAQAPAMVVQGWLALLFALLPLVLSLRHLAGRQEFEYRYEDIPPHVRRIAERERQRVELETARGIQTSILPDLPPSLNGVAIAHAYLPASEVGGDFYDVLALDDGRLALAVGDVAGHGVSSGLVMSMAKSALAVQVTFNPEVEAVFGTLNRLVFQTARKRLLTTLVYAVLDPERRELRYASAGHLFPYVVSPAGRVLALESVAYPLGVRGALAIESRQAQLAAGDILFLFSDGLVEARTERGEVFGFPRLEASLARQAGRSVEDVRDGVLADVLRWTGRGPREDDQTVLVLKVS